MEAAKDVNVSGGSFSPLEQQHVLRVVRETATLQFRAVGDFGKKLKRVVPMKSARDCQEFYAALLEAGAVTDNRFSVRGETWPFQLLLSGCQDAPCVVIHGDTASSESTAVATSVEGTPEAVEEGGQEGVPVPGERPSKKPRTGAEVAGRPRRSRAVTKKKTEEVAPAPATKRRREESLEQEQLQAMVPVQPPANVIRAKILEGDEVVAYYSTGSAVADAAMRHVSCCTACGSFEEQDRLLGCYNCAHFYHSFCLGMKNLPEDRAMWRCPGCKTCEKCHSSWVEDACLLVCEKCDRGFHTYCLDSPLPFIPMGDWLCEKHACCLSCGTKTAGTLPMHSWHDNDTLCHLCWTNIRNHNQCPSCLKAYDNDQWDTQMVGCECGRWVHRGCDGITLRLYQELQMPGRENELYFCVVCRSNENRPQFSNPELQAMVELPEESSPPRVLAQANDNGATAPAVRSGPVVEDVVPLLVADLVRCALCRFGSCKQLGRLVPISRARDMWVHCGCAIWSRDVSLRKSGGVVGLEDAVREAKLHRCVVCNQPGASLHCRFKGCTNVYHLPCAMGDRLVGVHRMGFFCPDHNDGVRGLPLGSVEVGLGKAFVTLPATLKSDRTAEPAPSFVNASWEDRLKAFIFKNPSAFLNQQYEAQAALAKSSGRDVTLKMLTTELSNGTIMQRGPLEIVSFGTASVRAPFHTSRYIFPIGFLARRRFWSYKTPDTLTLYHCVIENVNDAPLFTVEAEDDAGNVVSSNSPAAAWDLIVKRFVKEGENAAQHMARGGGDLCWQEEMFGLTAWVVSAIECLPGASGCAGYNFQFWPRSASSSNMCSSEIDHPLGCARLIPYAKGGPRKDGGAFVYSRVTGVVGAPRKTGGRKTENALESEDAKEVPDFIRFRKLEQHPLQLVVHKSRIHGMGVYSLTPVKQFDFIIEYQGEIIRPIVADKREREYEQRGIPCYLWKLDEKRIVDATFCGNMARFINHCHDPNCEVNIVNVNGDKKVMVSAKRDIVPGEELTYDYCFDIPEDTIPCHCGAMTCPGLMNLPPLGISYKK